MGFIIETKHCGGWEKIETIIERYQPQLQWQMLVTGARRAAISVIQGASEPVIEWVHFDEEYAAELWKRAEQFMECVWSLTPPVAAPAVAAPVKPEKIYDMTGSNEWGANAATWIMHRQAAKDFDAATKAIKSIVTADAIKCSGYGISVTRSKTGALTIREKE